VPAGWAEADALLLQPKRLLDRQNGKTPRLNNICAGHRPAGRRVRRGARCRRRVSQVDKSPSGHHYWGVFPDPGAFARRLRPLRAAGPLSPAPAPSPSPALRALELAAAAESRHRAQVLCNSMLRNLEHCRTGVFDFALAAESGERATITDVKVHQPPSQSRIVRRTADLVPNRGRTQAGGDRARSVATRVRVLVVSPPSFSASPVVWSCLTVDAWPTFAHGTKVPSLRQDAMRTFVRRRLSWTSVCCDAGVFGSS